MKITVEIVEQMRQRRLQEELDRKNEHEQLKLVLAAYDGKRITSRSRIAPFHLDRDGRICGKYCHFFTNPVDVRKLAFTNRCNYNAERIKHLEELDVEKVAEVFGRIQEGFDAILQGFWDVDMLKLDAYHNPLFYELTRLMEGEDSDKDLNINRLYAFRRPHDTTTGSQTRTE